MIYPRKKEWLLYISVLLALLVNSCTGRTGEEQDRDSYLRTDPRIVELNTNPGYAVNQLTGKPIQPIINGSGDTVVTGVPIAVEGRIIDPGSVEEPHVIPMVAPSEVPAHQNVRNLSGSIESIPVDKSSLIAKSGRGDFPPFTLVSTIGDTIPTGIPIPVEGKTVPCIQPKPVKAGSWRMKDNASLSIKYFSMEQGLKSPQVWCMLEDSRSILWFGGEGVLRYDGESLAYFSENEGLLPGEVSCILEDRLGNLWFGTWGGLSMYDGKSFTNYTLEEGLTGYYIWSMLEDRKGNIWIGTYGGGLCKYDGESFTHYTTNEGLSDNTVRSILEDSQGNLWFGTLYRGVNKYDGKTFTCLETIHGLPDYTVISMLEDSQGNLWFGTWEGISMFDGKSLTNYTVENGLSHGNIRCMLEDSRGRLWLGTREGGVNIFDGEKFISITQNEGLSDDYVNYLMEDSHDNIWLCTNGGGICRYETGSFVFHSKEEELGKVIVSSVLEDGKGKLWFGTAYNGLYTYDGEKYMHYDIDENIIASIISGIQDSQGNLWFGDLSHVVVKYDGKKLIRYTRDQGLGGDGITDIHEDIRGNIWFAHTGSGVCSFDGNTFMHFTEKEGLGDNDVRCILEDQQNNLWFATGAGVIRYDGVALTHFSEKEGLPDNFVISMNQDKKGNLWFGTNGGGACMFDGQAFVYFNEANGLSSNCVITILEDSTGNIWLGTAEGLNLVRTDGSRIIHNYTFDEGLKNTDFNGGNSALLDSKNRIWWGAGDCLTMLDMNDFRVPVDPPRIRLERIELNEQFIDFRNPGDTNLKPESMYTEVAAYHNYPLDLRLPYSKNTITFHFSAIDLSYQGELSYQFMLDGYDNTWNNLVSDNHAAYRKIPPGSYTFRVRTIGISKRWSEVFEYSFSVNPPWYRTVLAYCIYGILILSMLYGFIRWRTWRIRKERDELEMQVRDRTRMIRKQKEEIESQKEVLEQHAEDLSQQKEELQITLDRLRETQDQLIQSEKMASLGGLVAGVAHEINTPVGISVTAASSLAEETREMAEKYKSNKISRTEFKDYLNTANQSAKLILSNMERAATMIQSFKQVSVDQSTEQKRKFKLKEYSEDVIRSLYPKLKQKEISFSIDIDEKLELDSYPGAYSQILTNLVLNSLIHGFEGREKGKIEIAARQNDRELVVNYRDDGKGIPESYLERIFDPFFSTDKKAGTGLGLHIVYNLVNQKLQGTINCSSKEGKGAGFLINIPV